METPGIENREGGRGWVWRWGTKNEKKRGLRLDEYARKGSTTKYGVAKVRISRVTDLTRKPIYHCEVLYRNRVEVFGLKVTLLIEGVKKGAR